MFSFGSKDDQLASFTNVSWYDKKYCRPICSSFFALLVVRFEMAA